jgi:hypothetical protein
MCLSLDSGLNASECDEFLLRNDGQDVNGTARANCTACGETQSAARFFCFIHDDEVDTLRHGHCYTLNHETHVPLATGYDIIRMRSKRQAT